MLAKYLDALRQKTPSIHCITNAVSAPLCANGLLATGAKAVMADAPEEVAEITAVCQGLCLNLGMPNPRKLWAMMKAGQAGNVCAIPVVLDPVGVGASTMRTEAVEALLDTVSFTAIRGNVSELLHMAGELGHGLGVEAGETITQESLPRIVALAKALSWKTGAVIVISSGIDVVAYGTQAYAVYNGHPQLTQVSGSGCLLSAVLTAFLAASPEAPLEACVAAVCAMGICGEQGAQVSQGAGSFAVALLDAWSTLQPETLEQEAQYEAQ